jgi:hypothetical protein
MNFKRLQKVRFSKEKPQYRSSYPQREIIIIIRIIIRIIIIIAIITIIITSSKFGEVLLHCLQQKKKTKEFSFKEISSYSISQVSTGKL